VKGALLEFIRHEVLYTGDTIQLSSPSSSSPRTSRELLYCGDVNMRLVSFAAFISYLERACVHVISLFVLIA
jgi:hypothetical protein